MAALNESDARRAAFAHCRRLLLAEVGYAQMMGIDLALDGDRVVGSMISSGHVVGNTVVQALHGGAVAGFLTITAVAQAMHALDLTSAPRVSTCTFEYMRSAQRLQTHAVACVKKRSRRFVQLRVEAHQGDPDAPIAAATVHCLLAR